MISTPVFCPRFVGRQRELTYLIERRRELAKAHGGIVLVGGDAGIGKSRLVREFLAASGRSRGRVAVGRCRPFASAPYEPLAELLATFAPPAARLIPAQSHEAQLGAVAGAFITAAQKHALVGIIEDLHWSDSGTLDVLMLLAERLATTRLLLVATYRANELGPEHPHYVALGALERNRSVAAIALTPLGPAETRDFIDATLDATLPGAGSRDSGDVPLDVRRQVARVAEGNPFFTEELLRSVVDRGDALAAGRSLPTTVRAAIIERMRPLTDADRAVLTQAAVIGRRFEATLLAHTLQMPIDAVLPALQRARALQIVEETPDPAMFRFRHALTREAIYDGLLTAQRRPLHRRIAQALEAQAQWNTPADALGYHWWAAGDRAKALEYGERSGDAAQALHSYADSIECYERTLGLIDGGGPDAARLRAKLGTSYFRAGFMDRAIESYRESWGYYETQPGAAPFVFRLARNLAVALYNDGRHQESTTFLGVAVAVIARCGDRGTTARARVTHASYLADCGGLEQSAAELAAIDSDLLATDTGLAITFWQTTCSVSALRGDGDGLRLAAARICAIPDHPADASALIDGLAEAGVTALIAGETAVARRCLSRAIQTCVAIGSSATLHGDMLVTSALERTLAGAFDEARTLLVRALPMIGEVKISRMAAVLAALAVGSSTADRELLEYEPDAAFIDAAFATGKPQLYGPLAAVCAQLLAARGEGAAARRLLRRALQAATAAVPLFGSFPLVIVAAQLGEPSDAPAIRRLCALTAGSGPAPRHAGELAAAILGLRFGDAAAARAPARAAAAGFAGLEWPLYEALAREAAGDARAASNIRERLRYRGSFVLKTRAQVESAAPELALTPREFEVARLVAAGGTNREIAATLNVSVKLVEKHLSSIYAKLALTSRSQLTARLVALDRPGNGADPGPIRS